MIQDTIVAPATPHGESALAIVRLSGSQCAPLSEAIFGLSSPALPRQTFLGNYRDASGNFVDQVVYVLMEQGHSFTGEATLEIFCHGNPLIVKKIVSDCVQRGCRLAEPGEFTRRAFLNGKLDLSQAEAVADRIHAKSEAALRHSARQLSGGLRERVDALVGQLLQAIALVEVYTDFPEEDLPQDEQQRPLNILDSVVQELRKLIASQRHYATMVKGVRTVILGAPNAGKSSLLNALVGHERALVSPIPGTTRDFISEPVQIGEHALNIVDTAGLHESDCALEQLGMQMTEQKAKEADCFILVRDVSERPPTLPQKISLLLTPQNTLIIDNKQDLLPAGCQPAAWLADFQHHTLSLKTGLGVLELSDAIVGWLERHQLVPSEEACVINLRHREAFERALEAILEAQGKIRGQSLIETASLDLRRAIEAMECIVGRFDNEAVLDIIFAKFCIGK